MADNTCTLNVKTSSGNGAATVKVTTEVSGGLSCIGGRTFHTDRDGFVELRWSRGCYLRTIYLNGKSRPVDFSDGGDYTEWL